jgi:hypothetical protein
MVVDTVHDELVLANSSNDSVTVYARTASGNTPPLRTLGGAATGLSQPQFMALTGALPPTVSLDLNQAVFHQDETMILSGTLTPGSCSILVDAYVVVRAGSAFFSLGPDLTFVPGLVPMVTQISPVPFSGTILSLPIGPGVPTGDFEWLAALTLAGTVNVVGNLTQRSFSILP